MHLHRRAGLLVVAAGVLAEAGHLFPPLLTTHGPLAR